MALPVMGAQDQNIRLRGGRQEVLGCGVALQEDALHRDGGGQVPGQFHGLVQQFLAVERCVATVRCVLLLFGHVD